MNQPSAVSPLLRARVARGSFFAAPLIALLGFANVAFAQEPTRLEVTAGPTIQAVTRDSAVIVFETSAASRGWVEYGVNGACDRRADGSAKATVHAVALAGLEANTEYTYRVRANDLRGEAHRFRTACGRGVPFSFAVYGASRSVAVTHGRVARSVLANSPRARFVIHTGDFVDLGGAREQWRAQFFAPAREMLAERPLYPTHGNHDRHGQPWRDYFRAPGGGNGLWYTFEYGDASFVVLDTESPLEADAPQGRFLRETLSSMTTVWRVVVMHRAALSSGPLGGDAGARSRVLPVCEESGVDALFTGDDHAYERSEKEGVSHFNTGGGGAMTHPTPLGREKNAYSQAWRGELHHLEVAVSPERFAVAAISTSGEALERTVVEKAGAATATDPRRLAKTIRSEPGRRLAAGEDGAPGWKAPRQGQSPSPASSPGPESEAGGDRAGG